MWLQSGTEAAKENPKKSPLPQGDCGYNQKYAP